MYFGGMKFVNGKNINRVRHLGKSSGLYIVNSLYFILRCLLFQEHEKRCWSVDFNLMDPKLLASGSDDAKGNYIMMFQLQVHPPFTQCFSSPVKLWSTNLDNSVASIEAKANVCCVKFSPTSRYHLAFGCAGKIKPAHTNPGAPDKTALPRKGKNSNMECLTWLLLYVTYIE